MTKITCQRWEELNEEECEDDEQDNQVDEDEDVDLPEDEDVDLPEVGRVDDKEGEMSRRSRLRQNT